MRRLALVCLALLAACEARLEDGGFERNTSDAAGSQPAGDGSNAGTPDAPAVCGNGRVVYLNFDGVTLTDATQSDATQNRASWMVEATGTAPPYREGDADRATKIAAIVAGVRAQLSTIPVTVVTARPATGPYVMVVYGGDADDVHARFGGAVNELDCGDQVKSDVAWISDNVGSTQRAINFTVGAIGFGIGLSATEDPAGCMCGWDNACTSTNAAACTLSANIARDPAARQRCAGLSAQNELGAFDTAFCK